MAKSCPSCGSECSAVYECDECRHQFCRWCGRPAFVTGGPLSQHGCPECEPRLCGPYHTKISRDEDVHEDDDDREEVEANEDESASSSSWSDSSSDYSSGGDTAGWWVPLVVIAGILIFFSVVPAPGYWHRSSVPTAPQQQPAPTPAPQTSCPVYLFENTVAGTYHFHDQDPRCNRPPGQTRPSP
jgi:hypothetical protein